MLNKTKILSRKVLLSDRNHNVGNPTTLKKTAKHVASERFLNIKEIALFWYKQGIESQSPPTKLLNFWVSLEQIFKTSTISSPNSAGDKLVRTIGEKITSHQKSIEILKQRL